LIKERNMSNRNRGVAVITGASSGIGKVYADRFAKRGYDLLLVARRKDRLVALSSELQQNYGGKAEVLAADLAQDEDLKKVGAVLASNEHIAVLVNNAGTAAVGSSAELPIEKIEQQLNLNARAVTHLSQAILPGFVKRDSGTLINIGSVLSFFAYPFSSSITRRCFALADLRCRTDQVVPCNADEESGLPLWIRQITTGKQ
jgi:short-subunit dehydrogenase